MTEENNGSEVCSNPLKQNQLPQPTFSEKELEERAKQVVGEEITAESIQKALALQENTQDMLTKVPTPEEVAEFEKALKSRKIGELEVLEEISYQGHRALKLIDPKTGQETIHVLGAKDVLNIYYVRDPAGPEKNTQPGALVYIKSILAPYEINPNRLISGEIEQSLIATINSEMDVAALGPDFVKKLIDFAEGRIHYQNTAIKAKFSGKEFGGEIMGIQMDEHLEVLNVPGVKEAVDALEGNIAVPGSAVLVANNEGTFFRLGGGAATVERTNIVNYLTASLGIGQPEARRALDLAEKASHIFGASAYYDGLKLNGGVVLNAPGGAVIPMTADRFVSANVLEQLYPDPNLTTVDRFARFFEEHWDDIDRPNSCSGQGATHLKQALYYPIQLEKPGTPNKGKAEYLRRYAYLWVTSSFLHKTADPGITPKFSMSDFLDYTGAHASFKRDFVKLFSWAPMVSSAVENRMQFNAILNDPNVINATDLDPLSKLVNETMGYLSFDERKKAAAYWLRGLAIFRGFFNKPTFNHINADNIDIKNMLAQAENISLIDYKQRVDLEKRLLHLGGVGYFVKKANWLGGFWELVSGILKAGISSK